MGPISFSAVILAALIPLVTPADLPGGPPDDGIMAGPDEVSAVRAWAAAVFEDSWGADRIPIQVIRQDHAVLQFNRCCLETPIRIGSRPFARGLGTHATSELAVTIPAGATGFRAQVGIDNNEDTQGQRGSAVFIVEANGAELMRTPVTRGGGEPVPVDVKLPGDAKTLLLKVDTTEDGGGWDQADWADAQFVLNDGSVKYLDENQRPLLLDFNGPPFSFVYGGKNSRELLGQWPREVVSEDGSGAVVKKISWKDPETKLAVTAEVKVYTRYPAVDWVLYFENGGDKETPIIEDIQALDTMLRTGHHLKDVALHELNGDACAESTFLPKTTRLHTGRNVQRTPTGGRPSSISAFPWFTMEYGGDGVIAAIGWTGQWQARLDRAETGPTRVRAGMESTHLALMPAERIRSPRIVLMPWAGKEGPAAGTRLLAQNRWRRLMLFEYVPRLDGKPAALPTALQTFDRYNGRPDWPTLDGQLHAVEMAATLGCDTYWLDAAWFPGNFPNGVGNWFHKPDSFPTGLRPISEACHARGMRFVLWFEPERVAPNTQIARERPGYVFGGEAGGLFKLNEPEARRWLTDLLAARIEEYGLDVYRNDFNMDPLNSWRANDAPNRQGITEIRYVENLYAMWDELRVRRPGLLIDNCSSGGRRIDIEMCSRSVPLWRSDTNCSAGHPEWNQMHTMALNLYVPLNTSCVWMPDLYETRSAVTGGLLCQLPYLDPDFPVDAAKKAIADARKIQPYFYGDFYPLTPANIDLDQFAAYQFHRPDLNSGVVVAFRRPECPHMGIICGLQAIDPNATYASEYVDGEGKSVQKKMSGTELAGNLEIRIPEPRSSLVIWYTHN